MNNNSELTVAKLFELQSMAGARVIAGDRGLDHTISMLNIMEVPDIVDWVQEGDFLLTTAYSFKDHEEGLSNLIEQLINKKIAGFGIKTKRYVDKIPQKAIDMANAEGFPIIELPFEVSFSNILVEGFTEIISSQMSTLLRIDTLHKKLIGVMLSGGKLKDIAESLYNSFDQNAIALKDYAFDSHIILAEEELREYIQTGLERESFRRKSDGGEIKPVRRTMRTTDDWDGALINRIEVPIYSGNVEYGCLYVWENRRELTSIELSVLESSMSLIALEIYKNLSIFESQSSQMTEFFEGLLSGDDKQFKTVIKRSHFFNFQPQLAHCVLVISFDQEGGSVDPNGKYTIDAQLVKQRHLGVIHKINGIKGEEILAASKDNYIIVSIGMSPEESKKEARVRIRHIYEELEKHFTNPRYTESHVITAGRVYARPEDLWKSYREALQSVRYAKEHPTEDLVFFDALGVFRILTFEGIEQEIGTIRDDELGLLLEYDRTKGSDLVGTLREYFECHGNLAKVAEKQFVHYNTVVYRINRMREIAGIDFNDYDQCLSLQLALKINELDAKNIT